MSRGKILRATFALALIPTGGVLVLLTGEGKGAIDLLISKLGLALIIAGVVSAFREFALLRFESEETGENIAKRLHKQLLRFPPSSSGIRLVAPVRRGYAGYYTWAITTEPQDMFFAGRSVLHRIDYDFRRRGLGSAESMLARRLMEGSTIRILFLDPRSNIIGRLAKEEGQTSIAMLSDIATSIGICRRLYALLKKSNINPQARLQIRVYDEVPYFAYHKVSDKIIVGFYFATALGSTSSAFEIVDTNTQNRFEGHFLSIFDRASSEKTLLEISTHRDAPVFNENLYEELYSALLKNLGQEKTDQLIGKSLGE